MAIHPLAGKRVAIVNTSKDRHGHRFVFVQGPFSGTLRIPIEWTDLVVVPRPLSQDGMELKLDLRALINLSKSCQIAIKSWVDNSHSNWTMDGTNHQPNGIAHGCSKITGAEPIKKAKDCIGRSLGDAGSQVASRIKIGGSK